MNMSFNGADVVWVIAAGFVGVLASILWLYIGWRAMRAHERLAAAAEKMTRETQ
jgi:uncharacterized membrane protein